MENAKPKLFTPWALPAAGIVFAAGTAASVLLWQTHRYPGYLLGLLPALLFALSALALGLEDHGRLPRGTAITAGLVLIAGGVQFIVFGLLFVNAIFFATGAITGSAAGMALAVYLAVLILALGRVYRDASRRGLNALGWVWFCFLVQPYFIGFILYTVFVVLRDKRQSPCGSCGARITASSSFCTRCGTRVAGACQQCGRVIEAESVYCGGCGCRLADGPSPASSPARA